MTGETQSPGKASKLGCKAMAMRTHLGAILVAGILAPWTCALSGAQSTPPANPAPCTVAPQPEPCGTAPATPVKPNATERFPFPGAANGKGASSTSPAPDATPPNISGVPQAPETGAASSQAPAGRKDFPFPGDANKPGASAPPDGGSSSSSSSDDGSPVDPGANPDATPGLKDKGSEGTQAQPGRHLLHRVNPVGTKLQTPDEREAEDLDIAHFYTETGDLQGAYLRSQDAVKLAPDDPDAHFVLAEIALKLNKREEAIAEYNACLKLDPDEKEARASRKALARLKP